MNQAEGVCVGVPLVDPFLLGHDEVGVCGQLRPSHSARQIVKKGANFWHWHPSQIALHGAMQTPIQVQWT